MPYSLGPMHLSNQKKYEIQRTSHFEVIFPHLGEEVSLCVESSTLPNVSNDPIELGYGNSKVKVAGQAQFEDVELVVRDAIGADIEAKLWEWRKLVYNPETDKIGWAADYKKNGRIIQYAPDGTYERTWKLIGCWPTNFNPTDMSHDGTDKKTISMTISCDKCYPVRK